MSGQYANPLAAPDPKALKRTNVGRVISNEIIDMPLTLKARSGISVGDFVPFWEIQYECLDAVYSNGDPFVISFGSRLLGKDGNPLDKTQRPTKCAQAYAGLDIIAFPDDPEYEADEILGHVFLLEGEEFPTGKPAPMPIEHYGKDYKYDGTPRIVPSKKDEGGAGVAVVPGSSTPATTKEADAAQLAVLADAITAAGATTKEDIVKVVRDGGFGALTIDGTSVFRLAINDQLVDALMTAVA